MKKKKKIMAYTSILAILDMIIPIPFTALILIYVIFEKPTWFENLVDEIYNYVIKLSPFLYIPAFSVAILLFITILFKI